MIPTGHISLLIADGRRAKVWRLSLQREGFDAQQVPTRGSDAAKGDYWIVVPRAQQPGAQRLVSEFLAGQRDFVRLSPVSGPLLWGALAIILALVGFAIAGLASG